MAWFEPPDTWQKKRWFNDVMAFGREIAPFIPWGWWTLAQDRVTVKWPVEQLPAAVLIPATVPAPIGGMAWFVAFDHLPKPPPKQQPASAVALNAATLPPRISGIAWYKQPDVYMPRRWFLQDHPGFGMPVVQLPPSADARQHRWRFTWGWGLS